MSARSAFVFAAALSACALAGAGLAGEPPAAPGPEAPKAESFDPLAGQRYEYEVKGRDIFTYREAGDKGLGREGEVDLGPLIPPRGAGTSGSTGAGTPGGAKPPTKEEFIRLTIEASSKRYDEAEKFFASQKFSEAMQMCSTAQQNLEKVGAEAPDLYEKLSRLQKAAENLKTRLDVEKKFGEVNIAIQGIVYKDRGSAAVINGRILKEGEYVGETGVQVFRIERDGVIFLYETFKIRKPMVPEKAP